MRTVLNEIQNLIEKGNGATESELKALWNQLSDAITRAEQSIIPDFSSRLPLEDIEKKAKEWAESRSNGNAEQDIECEYDFKMGMIKTRNDLSGLNGC